MENKVFLSYAHDDFVTARRIYCDLKNYGIKVWFDEEELLPGQN